MGTVTVESSLERLDRILSRIERLSDAADKRERDYRQLDSRHTALRSRVAETIARLDTLIAEKPQADGAAV